MSDPGSTPPPDDATGASERSEVIPPALICGSYKLGHEAHWIQARLSGERPWTTGRASVASDGWIVIETTGTTMHRWTHDPGRMQTMLDHFGPEVEIRSQGVLAIKFHSPDGSGERTYIISVGESPSPCPSGGAPHGPFSPTDLVDLVLDHGGFSVQARQIRRTPARGDKGR